MPGIRGWENQGKQEQEKFRPDVRYIATSPGGSGDVSVARMDDTGARPGLA